MMDRRVDPTQAAAELRLGGVIRNVLASVALLALIGVLLPADFGKYLETAAVAIVLAIPIVRVLWLIRRWWRQGDHRFVRWACLLIALMAIGPVLAILGN